MSGNQVLVVYPLPIGRGGHGSISRVLTLAEWLAKEGTAVDFVVVGEIDSNLDKRLRRSFRTLVKVTRNNYDTPRPEDFQESLAGYAIPDYFIPSGPLTATVRGLVSGIGYRAIISSYCWTAPIVAPLRGLLRILDVQDIFHLHARECRRATGSKTNFELHPKTEAHLWRQWDALLAITDEDASYIQSHVPASIPIIVAPHGAQFIESEPRPGLDDRAAYFGSDNDCNIQSLRWFLREVWPRVLDKRPTARLTVSGLISDRLRQELGSAGVKWNGFVQNIDRQLKQAGLVVAPYTYGSGLKIKVIEALSAGKAVITTTAGAAGAKLISGQHAVVTNDPSEMAARIAVLLGNIGMRLELGRAALAHADRVFSNRRCYGSILKYIKGQTPTSAARPEYGSAIVNRIQRYWEFLKQPKIAVYGNGGHTRYLLEVLRENRIPAHIVIDRNAETISHHPEGVTVIPVSKISAHSVGLIVLSSQSYEKEMWKDLESVRSSGHAVIGLYNTHLVTPNLASLEESRSGTFPVGPDLSFGRFLICDPNLKSSAGHYLSYSRHIFDAARRLGSLPIVAANRKLSLSEEETCWKESVLPVFDFDYWEELTGPENQVFEHLLRRASSFASALSSLADSIGISAEDHLFLPYANLVELLGLRECFAVRPNATPILHCLFRLDLEDEARCLRVSPAAADALLAYAMAGLYREFGRAHVKFWTDSKLLSSEYSTRLGVPFGVVPIPVDPSIAPTNRGGLRKPLKLLYLGDARDEKGFDQLTSLLKHLGSKIDEGSVHLAVQGNLNPYSGSSVRIAHQRLSRDRRVELIDNPLSSEEYRSRLLSADLILLPYQAQRYRRRTSGILAEALCAGLPVVIPDGTWMSAQLDAGFGAGVRFGGGNGTCFSDAVKAAVEGWDRLRSLALERAASFHAVHSPDNFVSKLLRDSQHPLRFD